MQPAAILSLALGLSPGSNVAMSKSSSALYLLAGDLLADLGWPSVDLEKGSVIGTVWADESTTYRSLFVIEDESKFVFYTQAPHPVPERLRAAAALMVTRANWGLPTAAIELDVDTGETRVRCGVDLGEQPEPTLSVLRQAVLANVAVSTVYLPGLALVCAGADPETVIASIEGPSPANDLR
jgi:hypothetical protein